MLRAAWEGAPLPPVAAPKAVIGEYGGGLLAAAVLAAAGAPLGPTPGFAEPDPELGIVPPRRLPAAGPVRGPRHQPGGGGRGGVGRAGEGLNPGFSAMRKRFCRVGLRSSHPWEES